MCSNSDSTYSDSTYSSYSSCSSKKGSKSNKSCNINPGVCNNCNINPGICNNIVTNQCVNLAPPPCRPIQLNANRIRALLLGKTYACALSILGQNRLVHRIKGVDNLSFLLTLDFNPNRVNLSLASPCNYTPLDDPMDVMNFVNSQPCNLIVTDVTVG